MANRFTAVIIILLSITGMAAAQVQETAIIPSDSLTHNRPPHLTTRRPASMKHTPEGYPVLTLDDCIRMTILASTDFHDLQVDSITAGINRRAAENRYLPTLSADLGTAANFGRRMDKSGVLVDESGGNATLGVNASYTLFDGLNRESNLATAKLTQQKGAARRQAFREKVAIDVINMYYSVLMEEDLIALSQQELEQIKYTLKYTKEMVDAGKWPRIKLVEIESQLSNKKLALVDAENNLFKVRLNLALNVDYGSADSLFIVDPQVDRLIDKARAFLLPAGDIYNEALNNRAEIKRAELGIALAEENVRAARSGYWPTVSLVAGYNNGYYYPFDEHIRNASLPFNEQIKHNARYSIGLNFSIPLFDGLRTSSKVRLAQAQVGTAKVESVRVQQAIYRSVVTARANAAYASEKIDLALKSEAKTKEAYDMAQAAYEAGRSTTLDLEQARNRYQQARIQAVQAKYDFVYKATVLEQYLGGNSLR